MAAVGLQIDPTSEDANNVPLDINDGTTYLALEESWPDPELDIQRASSVDTDGDPLVSQKYRNIVATVKLRVYGGTYQALQTAVFALQQKASKINREGGSRGVGGTIKRTAPSGTAATLEIVSMRVTPAFEHGALVKFRDTVTLTLECLPGWLTAEQTLSAHTETTLPCLVFTETAIKGDLPGRPRLVISDAQGVDQWFVMWGQQSRYYDSASSAALFYEAEGRTAMGGSATAAGPTGASGGGSNVMRNTALTLSYQAILSTQATGGGAHLSHIGDFRVWARVQVPTSNTGTVSVALEWAPGDYRSPTQNATYAIDPVREGSWVLADLGQVHLAKVPAGTQRWEGRVLAKSTVNGDDIDIDCLFLVPVTEGSGEAKANITPATPTSFVARDEFDQTAGALNTKTPAVGAAWSTTAGILGSATTDFQVDATNHWVTRVSNGGEPDLYSGRTGMVGSSAAATLEQVDVSLSGTIPSSYNNVLGLLLRGVSSSVYGIAGLSWAGTGNPLRLTVRANSSAIFADVTLPWFGAMDTWFSVRALIDAGGRIAIWVFPQNGSPGDPVWISQDAAFATGGALASGKPGIYHASTIGTSSPQARFDNFWAATPVADAAIFASQSIELRGDQVIREDSGGTLWQLPSRYEGTYPKIPPAGKEARTLRLFVKASRNDPDTMADSAIDDITAQLFYRPRYLVLPE